MGFITRFTARKVFSSIFIASTLTTAALGLAACQGETLAHGYVLDEKALEQIKVGSSAEQVLLVLGNPSTTSTVGNKTYYYISQRTQQRFRFMNPTITEQRVLAIYLDNSNKVERIANYGLKDGVIFDFISRKTETGGEEQAFLRSLFRSMENIMPGLGL
jgi:outer membrane protein assembly factor BamE (lipoprotein component of BamABCDE complex)